MTRSRDIAAFLGKTEANNAQNLVLLNTSSEVGFDSAEVTSIAAPYGTQVFDSAQQLPLVGLIAGQRAFTTNTNRFYISNGSGWYSVATINATPTFSLSPDASYILASDGVTATTITILATDPEGFAITYSAIADSDFNGLATVSQDSSVFTITPKSQENATASTGTLTFKATDGVNIASEISTFTLSFGPDWSATPTESILRASDGQANDKLGNADAAVTSISGDGNYAVVGAPNHDNNGAFYVFVKSGSTWSQQAKITGSASAEFMGSSASINYDGTYIIVGARGFATNTGAAYVFTRSGSTWSQQQRIQASDAQSPDYFGWAVSINSDATYAIVGAPYEDTNDTNAGSAYIFSRSGSTWTQRAKIQPSEVQASDQFGLNVSMSGDGTYVVISSHLEDGGGGDPLSNAGAAYIFTGSGSTWTQQAKLVPNDTQVNDRFGWSVSINNDGTYAIVSAYQEDGGAGDPILNAGAAYIFTRSGSTWTQQAKITASDAQASDFFGWSVAVNSDGTFAIIGAWGEDGGAGDPAGGAGAAYIFSRSESTWTEIKKLTASDAQAGDGYGGNVSISGDGTYTAVSASTEDGGTGDPISNSGALYIYKA